MLHEKKRLPPGQRQTDKFPVLQHGGVIHLDREKYLLRVDGLVDNPVQLNLEQIKQLPKLDETVDIHCVTTWSKFDTKWAGVPFKEILYLVKPKRGVRFIIMHCADAGFTTSLPLEAMADDDVLVAYEYEGKPITDDHGGPVRTVVPQKYFYKSAKWLVRLELVAEDQLGYWERSGYSNAADPWKEERYS